jgi:hypothetical protein
MVSGVKAGTYSNGGGAALRNLTVQESLMNVPFTCGVAPSFRIWKKKMEGQGGLRFEEGRLPGVEPGVDLPRLDRNGFYQTPGVLNASDFH